MLELGMDYNKLAELIGSDEFAKFFDELVAEETTGESQRRYSRAAGKDQAIIYQTDTMVLETYLSMMNMFDSYPALKSISPSWSVKVDSDNSMIIPFQLDIEYVLDGEVLQEVCRYDECPEEFGDTQAFEDVIETGELLMPEHWNDLICKEIFTRQEPYRSKEEVIEEMNSSLSHYLPRIKKWALDNMVQEKNTPNQSKPSMKM